MEILNVANTLTKEILLQMINQVIDDSQWSSKEAAYVLRIPLADISHIKRLNTASFSVDRLLILLMRLNFEVKIFINSKETHLSQKS